MSSSKAYISPTTRETVHHTPPPTSYTRYRYKFQQQQEQQYLQQQQKEQQLKQQKRQAYNRTAGAGTQSSTVMFSERTPEPMQSPVPFHVNSEMEILQERLNRQDELIKQLLNDNERLKGREQQLEVENNDLKQREQPLRRVASTPIPSPPSASRIEGGEDVAAKNEFSENFNQHLAKTRAQLDVMRFRAAKGAGGADTSDRGEFVISERFRGSQSISSSGKRFIVSEAKWSFSSREKRSADYVKSTPLKATSAAQFVAELSELVELDAGHHVLLANIVDRHLFAHKDKE